MERKVKFAEKEYYHLFSRGVEKRKIFMDKRDYERFLALLYILNQKDSFHVSNFLKSPNKTLQDLYQEARGRPLVSIQAYSLMPNHFHLVVQEVIENGISTFMMKLLTAYSMYFNIKKERSGPLFVHPFRSEHIDNDPYFLHIFKYVHMNSLSLYEKDWEERGIKDKKKAREFLEAYSYSSFMDFRGPDKRIQAKIIDFNSVPDFLPRATLDI